MSRTDLRTRASWMAREQDVVVLPTPPFPPTNIHRRVFCWRIDWRVGSRVSGSSEVEMVAVVGGGMVVVVMVDFCTFKGGRGEEV